jgi:hypothetical protein
VGGKISTEQGKKEKQCENSRKGENRSKKCTRVTFIQDGLKLRPKNWL